MDSNIEQEVITARKKNTLIYILCFILIVIAGILLLRFAFSSSLNRSQITTAVIERGDIENTINASGEVLPEFEEIISSPIVASVQKVLMDAGSSIKAGQSILTLDKSAAQTEYEKLRFQLESKQNDIRKIKLDLDKSFYDLKSNNDIKQLRINSLRAAVENARRLVKAGGGTREDLEQAALDLKVALLEKKQLENEIVSKQQTMHLQIKEAALAASIQQNALTELFRKLQQADVLASRPGVVTWVNKNIGATVQPGEMIARIADLSSFKIKGSLSDNYLDQLRNGMPAIIRINETLLRGKVVMIYPAIQNGAVSFDVQPDQRSSKLFRPNLKAEIFLVTDKHSGVLRVHNGPAFKGAENEYIYVLQNNIAQRTLVKTGMSNFDFVELKDRVKAGDTVITSDMSEYKNSEQIKIQP